MRRIAVAGILFFLCNLIPLLVQGQNSQNPELLFKQARNAAFEQKNYDKAINLAKEALEIVPDYQDITVFLGRIYFWNGDIQQARFVLEALLERNPAALEARLVLMDLELKQDNPHKVLELAKENPDTPSGTDILFRRGRALQMLQQDEQALQQYRNILQEDPQYPHVHQLIHQLKVKKLNWQFGMNYLYDWFSDTFDPWHMMSFQLTRMTQAGNFTGRINYGHRFSNADLQVEVEGYPRLTSRMYAYILLGYSESVFFPEYRSGLSLYRFIPGEIEVEAGLRYLRFNLPNLLIYTGSLSKNFPNLRVKLRSFWIPDLEGDSFSLNLDVRRFFSNTDNYLSLRFGFGSAATELNTQQDINRLSTADITMEVQKEFSHRILFRGELGYSREEFSINAHRDRWTAGLKLDYRF